MSQRLTCWTSLCLAVVLLSSTTRATAADDGAWGTVKGQIVFGGASVPEAPKLNVDKDQNVCLMNGPILSEEWVINPKNKGVRWVFVWLVPESGAAALAVHPGLKEIKVKEVTIDQPCCRFEPHAVALREGQILIGKNSAPIPHNLHWTGFPTKNPGGNIIAPPGQSIAIKDLKADRYPVEMKCDIHPWMKGWIRIFDHPYFALTDENGNFEIKNAPAGPCRMVIWHDSGFGPGDPDGKPRDGRKLTVKAGGATELGAIPIGQ